MPESTNKTVIAALQMSCSDSISDNLERAIIQIRKAHKNGANLICLQELFLSQYFCQTEDHSKFELAESIPGPSTDILCQLAAELKIVLIASLFERRAAGLFHNTTIVIENDGKIVGKYRKMHIPDDPGFHEKFYFTPGDLGFQAFSTSAGKIGVCICWDQWFPEAARLTAMAGAEVIIYPTAIGWLSEDKEGIGESQLSAWQTVMRSHAITNGVFVLSPNRVGTEGNIQFWGNSFVCDPYGNVMATASDDTEETIFAECDLSVIETARTHWPFLRDRRIDSYGDLTKRLRDDE